MVASDHVGIDPSNATVGIGVGEKGIGEGHGDGAVFFHSLQDGGRVCNPRSCGSGGLAHLLLAQILIQAPCAAVDRTAGVCIQIRALTRHGIAPEIHPADCGIV